VQKSSSVLIAKTNFSLLNQIVKQKAYEDLQNCHYYFAGNFELLKNNDETVQKCLELSLQVIGHAQPMQFESDMHVKNVMNIFKTGISFQKGF
jgi:hypothetical protein